MKRLLLASLVLATMMAPMAAVADANAAAARLVAIGQILASKGLSFPTNSGQVFYLVKGQSAQVTRSFSGGIQYAIVASGDDACRDVDIEIFDQNWNLIARDGDTGREAVVTFQPKWTGTFYVRVKLYDAVFSGGYVGYITAYQ